MKKLNGWRVGLFNMLTKLKDLNVQKYMESTVHLMKLLENTAISWAV